MTEMMTERYEIRETKDNKFEVFDHLDRGKKIATFLYFKDAARFCLTVPGGAVSRPDQTKDLR
jgi:hypothetical protein